MSIVSKLSSKGQITIPASIRAAMSLEPGDFIAYDLNGKIVRSSKQNNISIELEYHRLCLCWRDLD